MATVVPDLRGGPNTESTSILASFEAAPDGRTHVLAASLIDELHRAWQQGRRVSAEELLAAHPELSAAPEAAVWVVYEEICLRRAEGDSVSTGEIARRFPQWESELLGLMDQCYPDEPIAPAPLFPEPGETLGEYRIVSPLGRGVLGQVYLAVQPGLAHRPVVLKLSARRTDEHLALARLPHPHVMPLYALQEFPERNLCALCMPYRGGETLTRLLKGLDPLPYDRRTGRHLLDLLDQAGAASPVAVAGEGPARRFLGRASYEEAICWIGACLADALQFAHDRGLMHLDIKPSNVLLAADGTPLLLDFHLARAPLPPGEVSCHTRLGGTNPYMSPEQHDAIAAMLDGRPLPAWVDGRTDLYALGVLMLEALTGPISHEQSDPADRLKTPPSGVSPETAAILAKCLARDPADRYRSAAGLAADLKRRLAAHKPEPKPRSQGTKRRGPGSIARLLFALNGLAALIAVASVVGVMTSARQGRLDATEALHKGQAFLEQRHYPEAVDALTRGLGRLDGVSESDDLRQSLVSHLAGARRGVVLGDLHTLADRLRALYGSDAGVDAGLIGHCRSVWEGRRRLLEPVGVPLAEEAEQTLRADLLDLAILAAHLETHSSVGSSRDEARRRAIRMLDEAERAFGPGVVLDRERRMLTEGLDPGSGRHRADPGRPPRSAWEHYALGRLALQAGDLGAAAEALDRAVDLDPHAPWAHFHRGVCAYRRGQFAEAVGAFDVCIALLPASAPSHLNRALALAALGRLEPALHDLDRALKLDPTSAAAAFNRALVHHRAHRPDQAEADLRLALRLGADPANIHYHLALVALARGDTDAARAALRKALRSSPDHPQARSLERRLQSGLVASPPS